MSVKRVALGLGSLLLSATQARAYVVPAGPPPVSPDVPPRSEEVRTQMRVVPPARPLAEVEKEEVPVVLVGTLLGVQPDLGNLLIETEAGPRAVQAAPGVRVTIDGEHVAGMKEMPEGHPVRATLDVEGQAKHVAVTTRPGSHRRGPPR